MKLGKHHKLSKYNLLLENSQELIIFFDHTGRIIDCSSKAINELGYGVNIYNIQIDDIFKNAFFYENTKFGINDKYLNSIQETTAYRKNQTCFPVELKVSILKRNKKYIGICNATNVSEKKEALREISELNNDLKNYNQISSELVARIAHELRTPVNGILGFSNNILDMELIPSQVEAVNIIKRCCSNMNTIINELLDYAKISNNKLVIEKREFCLRGMLRNVVEFNIPQINEKGLKLQVDVSKDIPYKVIGDELRLSQILNNLISNAVKFTSVGQISLEVSKVYQEDRHIELFFMVIDTGIGIAREEKDKLFKSFSQVDSSITRRFGGTGLGLSISKKLVEAMHGSIEVESEKNKGSTFSFSVRLELPQKSASTSNEEQRKEERITFRENTIDNNQDKDFQSFKDYINVILKDNFAQLNEPGTNVMDRALIEMNNLLEKLIISIEMENWEKAEELAYRIKNLIPKDHTVVSKHVFRLLLAVRKENHDSSLSIINELKSCMCKEK